MTAYKRDGSWEWATKARNQEIQEIIDEYNTRAKYCKIYHNGTAKKQPTAFSIQFSWYANDGDIKKTQYKKGIGVSWSRAEVHLAIQKAETVDLKLRDNSFTFTWLDEYIKGIKPMGELQKKLSRPLGELISEFKTSKRNIKNTSWEENYEPYFNKLLNIPKFNPKFNKSQAQEWLSLRKVAADHALAKPISRDIISAGLDRTDQDSTARSRYITAITAFLKYHEIYGEFKDILEKAAITNKPKKQPKYVPSDQEIIHYYNTAFIPPRYGPKKYIPQFSKWQWLYGLLATYGLRIHEAWNIENWDKPVTLKGGQWEVIDDEDNEITVEKDLIVPAMIDPANQKRWLAISHKTKTGYRVAMPLSPTGHNWLEEFDLLSGYNLPDYKPKNPNISEEERQSKITSKVVHKFITNIGFFSAHCLRHAFNHRARVLGLDIPSVAISLGHSEQENSSTYAKHMAIATKLQLLDKASNKAKKSVVYTYDEALELVASNYKKPMALEEINQLLSQIYGISKN